MVFKKLVSGIASLALALSVFAGLSVTANAEAATDGTYARKKSSPDLGEFFACAKARRGGGKVYKYFV